MSSSPWEPEAALELPGATALIYEAWPDLEGLPTRVVGVGWDNLAVGVGPEVVVRIARRTLAEGLLRTEVRWTAEVATGLPLPAAVAMDLVELPQRYPFPLARYRWLPGRPASDGPWSRERREAAAPTLGAFLGALHQRAPSEPALRTAPRDDLGRMDFPGRLRSIEDRLVELRSWRPQERTDEALARMESLAGTPAWGRQPRWCHGDLYARHVLIDDEGAPCGVIDWGDLHLGDPAVDLSAAFGLLPSEARPAFWTAYREHCGEVHIATRDRARFRSLFSSFCLIHYGHAVGDHHLLAAGQLGWKHALAD